jgi:teichuronic acid biosynthesis glycosyltransferase TuaH
LVFRPFIDWSLPLFQRPQHIAINLANHGMLYFFCTNNQRYDNVSGFEEITNSCYLTNRFDLLTKYKGKKIYHLYSTDKVTGIDFIQRELNKGNTILYEYVDTIHEMVYRRPISPAVIARHHYIIQDEKCLVVTTADKLYQEVLNYRSKNCILCTNGVDYSHFHQNWSNTPVPPELVNLFNKKRPIIGYFGALARWFDYELIKFLASQKPEYEIVLIGWNYDDSIKSSGLDQIPNIHVIGPIDYQHLPQYARLFTVATIPFRLNEVTDSTSPIKLFEYMALGHPIVSTDIPECRKYQSVIIAKNQDEFVRHVDRAIAMKNDQAYQLLINKEALENTWDSKAKSIAELIFDSEKR